MAPETDELKDGSQTDGTAPPGPDPPEERGEPWGKVIQNLRALLQTHPRDRHDPARGVILDVYLELAQAANAAGECWPGIATIAENCQIGPRNVINAIAWLKKADVLTAQRRKKDAGEGRGSKPTLYTLALPYRPDKTTKTNSTTRFPILHNGQVKKDDQISNGVRPDFQWRTYPPHPPDKVEHGKRTHTQTDGSQVSLPGVSESSARKRVRRPRTKKPDPLKKPLEDPLFKLFWTKYPDCRYKREKGRMRAAWEVFEKVRNEPGFNMDNLLMALDEAEKACDDLDYFKAPENWLKDRPWLETDTSNEPQADPAKKEEIDRVLERLKKEEIPE